MDSAKRLHRAFRECVAESRFPSGIDSLPSMSNTQAVSIFRAQCVSRNLDLLSRRMQKEGDGFYTIGSSGHENMATVAEALRIDDMAFLHYRDAAFQIIRSMGQPGATPIRDMLLSFSCSTEDPISGGRHKVLGSRALNIPPQTSTIASHLPKAVGAAFSIGLSKRLQPAQDVAKSDSIVVCSFGDASCNHSTAQGAINAACWTSYKKIAMPLLFVCEDNGLGISVPTPDGWVAANFSRREALQVTSVKTQAFFLVARSRLPV